MTHVIATKILKLNLPQHPYLTFDFKETQEVILIEDIIPGTIEKIDDIFIFKIYNDTITDEYTCLSTKTTEAILIGLYQQQLENF